MNNNFVHIAGNISQEGKQGNKCVLFNVAVNKGKTKNGEDKGTMFVTVRVFGDANPDDYRKGLRVSVTGELDIYKYNEKNYTEIKTMPFDIVVQGSQNRNRRKDDFIPYN